MAKDTKTFRDFVTVFRAPYGWTWMARDEIEHGPFPRLAEAQEDAARVLGPIDWDPKPKTGGAREGRYGRHYTADEWLARG